MRRFSKWRARTSLSLFNFDQLIDTCIALAELSFNELQLLLVDFSDLVKSRVSISEQSWNFIEIYVPRWRRRPWQVDDLTRTARICCTSPNQRSQRPSLQEVCTRYDQSTQDISSSHSCRRLSCQCRICTWAQTQSCLRGNLWKFVVKIWPFATVSFWVKNGSWTSVISRGLTWSNW